MDAHICTNYLTRPTYISTLPTYLFFSQIPCLLRHLFIYTNASFSHIGPCRDTPRPGHLQNPAIIMLKTLIHDTNRWKSKFQFEFNTPTINDLNTLFNSIQFVLTSMISPKWNFPNYRGNTTTCTTKDAIPQNNCPAKSSTYDHSVENEDNHSFFRLPSSSDTNSFDPFNQRHPTFHLPAPILLLSPLNMPTAPFLSPVPEEHATKAPSTPPKARPDPVVTDDLPNTPALSTDGSLASTTSYKHVVSNIPSRIEYTSDSVFILCQLRTAAKNSAVTAYTLNALHSNGTAPEFIRTLIALTFQAQPTPPSIHNKIEIRQVTYVSTTSSAPTYSIRFSTTTSASQLGQDIAYARHNTPQYDDLQNFLHTFVFERWHTHTPLDLDVPPSAIASVQFIIPTLNHPISKPIAYISGLPPQLYGRKHVHTSLIANSIHTAVRPHLGGSKLHHLAYFRQALGVQSRSRHSFKKNEFEEVYLIHISNVEDQNTISKILFSPQTHTKPIIILGLPVVFLPIAKRPAQNNHAAHRTFYANLNQTLNDIRTRKNVLTKIPTIITPIFKDPLASTTRDIILKNKHIHSYTVVHANNRPLRTKLFIKTIIPPAEAEGIIRSWFSKIERSTILSPMSAVSSGASPIAPDKLLSNVLKSLPSSLDIYARTLGMTLTNDFNAAVPSTTTTISPIPDHTTTTSDDTISSESSSTAPDPPARFAPPARLKSPTISSSRPPPIIPSLPAGAQPKPTLQPLTNKRRALSSPNSVDSHTTANSPGSPNNKAPPAIQLPPLSTQEIEITPAPSLHPTTPPPPPLKDPTNISKENTYTPPSPSPTHESVSSDEDDCEDIIDKHNSSLRMTSHEDALRDSIPTDLEPFLEEKMLTQLSHFVYKSQNEELALSRAKSDLLIYTKRAAKAYRKIFKTQKKTKKKSSKKRAKITTSPDQHATDH